MALVVNGDGNITGLTAGGLPNGVITTALLDTAALPMGPGQSWQAPTRAIGTTYTNSTGRSIVVTITLDGSGPGARHDFSINGTVVCKSYATDYYSAVAATTHYQVITMIVPNGATYLLSTGSGTTSIAQWQELR